MNPADKQIAAVLARYDEPMQGNVWPVPGGKAHAILHKCIERMVVKAGIRFDKPDIVSADPANVVLIVTGRLGDVSEWSFGEASPKNNKNQYPYAMAEKRGKDRVALKLLGLHGLIYSEEEKEEFADAAPAASPRQASAAQVDGAPSAPSTASIRERAAPQPPKFQRPKSREEATQTFIRSDPARETLPPNDAEAVLNTLRSEMAKIRASGDLVEWAKKATVRDMVDMLPDDAAHGFREEYKTRLAELRLAVVGAG